MICIKLGQFNLLYRYPLRGLATMLAGTMMLVAVSIMMSFPNLNTYMISYMRARTNPEYSYSDFIWISQGRSIVCGKFLCWSWFLATPNLVSCLRTHRYGRWHYCQQVRTESNLDLWQFPLQVSI